MSKNEKFTKYVDLIYAMCIDCIITDATFLSNLKLMIPKMSDLLAEPQQEQPEEAKPAEPGEVDKMLDSIEAEPYPPEKFNRMLNKIKDGIATETIDKIFLELSQITSATTKRELSLQARIEELEDERDDWKRRADKAVAIANGCGKENKQLREALKKYGCHHAGCAGFGKQVFGPYSATVVCTCGLDAALKGTK